MFPPPPGDGLPESDPWTGPPVLGRPAGRPLWVALTASISLATFGAGMFVGATVLGRDDPPSRPTAQSYTPPPSAPASPPSSVPPGACAYRQTQVQATLPPETGVRRTGVVRVTIELTQGPVQVELFAGRAPCTVHSFLHLARTRFFDDTPCHRVTTRSLYVLQCGDPTGTGTSGPGYEMPDENLEGARYVEGTVAMANAGPGTGGSQFFVVYRDNPLPPNYTVFGRVTAGLDVVKGIAAKGAEPPIDGRPAVEVRIRRVIVSG